MTPAEFEEVAGKLAELEDYLKKQARMARAIGHNMDALTLDNALKLAIAAHAQCQLLVEHE